MSEPKLKVDGSDDDLRSSSDSQPPIIDICGVNINIVYRGKDKNTKSPCSCSKNTVGTRSLGLNLNAVPLATLQRLVHTRVTQ